MQAVVNIAAARNMTTTAEGVETEDQLGFVREAGCEEIQGYLFSKPLPVDAFEKLMATGALPFEAVA